MLPEPVRLAAHVLIDVATVWGEDRRSAARSLCLAAEGLARTGSVEVMQDGAGAVVVDVADLAFAGAVTIRHLVSRLAEVTGNDATLVTFDLREYLDGGP